MPGSYPQGRHCPVALVGERPGRDEGLLGRPFEDRAGLLLRKCLLLAGLRPEDCLLTLLVRCAHDSPTRAGEANLCKGWLWEELRAAAPRVVVALGAVPAATLTKNKGKNSESGWPGGPVVLAAPNHQTLASGGRAAEAAMTEVLVKAKELACSTS